MAKKQLLLIIGILIVALILCYGIRKETGEKEEIVPKKHNTVIAKQSEAGMEYFVKDDPYSVYNFLSSIEVKKTEVSTVSLWRYKVVLTDTLKHNDEGIPTFPNDNTICIIYVYDQTIEINGIAYTSPAQDHILDWFDLFYEKNASNYQVYTAK